MSIVLVHGDKGGAGKSTTAATYGEYVLARGGQLAVVDCDPQNPDVARYFAGLATIYKIDLREPTGWIELFNAFDEDPASDFVVSLPANIGAIFAENAGDLLAALAGTKRRAAIFWVLGRTADCIAQLKDALEAYAPAVPIIAVRNLFWSAGDPTLFTRWEGSKTRPALLDLGGADINFPELLDGIFDVTFGAPKPQRLVGGMSRYGDRLKLAQWSKAAFAAFDGIAALAGTGVR